MGPWRELDRLVAAALARAGMAACISDRLGSFAMTRDLAMLERVPTFAGLTPDTLEFLLERASEVVVGRRGQAPAC